jgi:hypothetical protein
MDAILSAFPEELVLEELLQRQFGIEETRFHMKISM